MVGVPKSKGCATCRARKIRCDEKWPVCQQCRRSDRQCPGPSNPHGKFMDEGPRQRARGMALRSTTAPNESAFVAALPDRHHDQHVHHTPCTDIETVRTRLTTSGAMFSTMRMVGDEPPATDRLSLKHDELPIITSPDIRFKKQLRRQQVVYGSLPRHLPLSGIELLTSKLVATINEEGPSNQIKLFGPFIGEVPRRLGSTTALNDAAACLTTTHDAIIRKRSKIRINPQLYAKALNSLHAAIQDPLQVRSTSTLCATVLLAITEAYATGICGTNRNFITHLGGAARILELRGPQEFQNPSSFERALLRAITVGVNLDAIFTDKDDILATPAWNDIAFDTTGVAEPRASMFKISRAMSLLPCLSRDVRAFFTGTAPPGTTAVSLVHRAEFLYSMLDEVRPYIDSTLTDPTRVRCVPPSPDHGALWPYAYRFADVGVAFVLWFFWNMRMISASIIIGLHRRPESCTSLPLRPVYLAELERERLSMARKVCMSWEHARAVRPLGAMYIDVGLIVAYSLFVEYEGDDGRRLRRWVLRALQELTDGHPGEGTGEAFAGREFQGVDWTAERVEWLGAWFTAGCIGRNCDGDVPGPRMGSSAIATAASATVPHGSKGEKKEEEVIYLRSDSVCEGGEASSGATEVWSRSSPTDSFLVLQPTGMKLKWHTTGMVAGPFL